jgi:hypothetical protein
VLYLITTIVLSCVWKVHFFRPVPKEYLHSAELRDIMQFGSSNTAVFFKMRVAGVLHIFQFETKQVWTLCYEKPCFECTSEIKSFSICYDDIESDILNML